MAIAEDAGRGVACPTCGGFALREPGGLRCLVGGHLFLYREVLPRDHWLSGTDRRNRERQWALDQTFMRPGRAAEFLFSLLERLEPMPQVRSDVGAPGTDESRGPASEGHAMFA